MSAASAYGNLTPGDTLCLGPANERRHFYIIIIIIPGPIRTVHGLFTGCFQQKSYVHSRGLYGPPAELSEFCLPVRSP